MENKFLNLFFKISDNYHGIFDKSKIIKEEELYINEKVFVFLRNNNRIISDNNQSSRENNENLLFCVRPKTGEYIQLENNFNVHSLKLTEENVSSLNHKLWYVIKDYSDNEKDINNINENSINEDYYLCKNDIIRLGNFKFILKDIHLKNYNEDFSSTNKDKLKYNIHDINKNNNPVFEYTPNLDFYILKENPKIICSICNQSICSIENPIVSLCDCESYQNKHYECLKEDFKKQIIRVQNNKKTSINYILKCHCYNCKTQIPLSFKIKELNKTYELIDFDKDKTKDYLFFESLEYTTKFEDYEKSFHLIELKDDKDITTITIGRDGSIEKHRDNDIKIFDPSVSRGNHAIIEYNRKEGTLLIENKSARSDTLIAIKEELKINRNKIHLQIGRTSIEACLLDKNKNNVKKIQTRKEYIDEIQKKTQKFEDNDETLTNDNFFDYSGKIF